MDFMFCLLSEQQQLLLPLEIDFASGLVLRGYLMNFGYLGRGDKGQASLGSEDKNVCVHIPFAIFLALFSLILRNSNLKGGGS